MNGEVEFTKLILNIHNNEDGLSPSWEKRFIQQAAGMKNTTKQG